VSSLVLLLLAFIFKNYIFAIISGFAFLGTGVYGMIFGFGNMTNLYTRIISYIIIGLGIILTIVSSFDYMKDMSGEGDDIGGDEDEF
jgi:disulfide bond formation protein DsbB